MRIKKTKKIRQQIIKELIDTHEIGTQEELLAELTQQGIKATQATLSRDLREMGVTKVPKGLFKFAYKIPVDEIPSTEQDLKAKFSNFVKEIKHTNNFIIIKTPPGEAMGVARVIDNAKFQGFLGTVAGDDTILVIINNLPNTRKLLRILRQAAAKSP